MKMAMYSSVMLSASIKTLGLNGVVGISAGGFFSTISEFFKESGMKVELKFMPWQGILRFKSIYEKFKGAVYWLPQEEAKKIYHYYI